MALTLVTKQVTFGDGTSGPAYFATDGTNFWPVSVLTDSNGALITDTAGVPITANNLPLPTGAATAANQPTVAAQGSTTATQSGILSQAAVTTGAPSYTSGQTSPLSLDASGNLRVSVMAGVASGNVGQGSTTSGETGPLIQGAVTTSAPSYTTAQTSPLSLTTAGRLRIDGSGTTQPISAADGANVVLGSTTDPIWTTGPATVMGLLQAQVSASNSPIPAGTNIVGDVRNITGSVSLPTGAATFAGQVPNLAQASTTAGQGGALIQGAVTTGAPTYVTAKTNPLSLTTAGALRVDGSGVTQPISGTVTANAGTGTMAVSAASLPLPAGAATSALQPTAAAQGSTTSGQTGNLMQGAVTTAAPSYTTAQTSPISLDTAGNLRVNVVAGGASGNVGQASTTSGETGPMVQGAVTTGSPTYTTGQTNPLSLDTSGNLRVNVVAGGASGNVAQASTTSGETGPMAQGAVTTSAPTYTTAQTNPLSLTTAGRLRIDGSGTTQPISAASASIVDGAIVALGTTTDPIWTTGPATLIGLAQAQLSASNSSIPAGTNIIGDVRNITGSVTLPTGAATLAAQVPNLAQASTTSGQGGALIMGAVTTSAPTYTTAKTNPLSITTTGLLRTDGSGVVQPASQSGTWTVQPGNTANTTPWLVDASSSATLPLPTGASTAALQPSNVSQGTAIGTLTGTMMMAQALTSAPQPTTATVYPLNTDGSGGLRVSNNSISQVQTPTVTANGAYTAGQLLGSKLTYSLFTTQATIQSITVTSESILTANLAAYIFHSSTSGTYSDKATPAITQADKVKLLAVVPLTNPSSGMGTHTVWWASGLNLNLANNTFYVYILCVDALTLTANVTTEVAVRVTLKS